MITLALFVPALALVLYSAWCAGRGSDAPKKPQKRSLGRFPAPWLRRMS